MRTVLYFFTAGVLLTGSGCQPTVQIATPKEPITINLNIKIDHEIRVKVDRELEEMFIKEKGLF